MAELYIENRILSIIKTRENYSVKQIKMLIMKNNNINK